MTGPAQNSTSFLEESRLPRIVFVLGKGGVGRSTISAAVGSVLAERGDRVLILEWALEDSIGPWFGVPPARFSPILISPRLSVCNFSLQDSLRAYFVDHLHLAFLYRRVIDSRPVSRLLEIAPGLAEMFFLGELWWITTLARQEAGWNFDRIVVDAPATGHAASLLDVPSTLAAMGAAGLLAVETNRVAEMMADPMQVGAIIVALPEQLVVDETLELLPRVQARLGRAPLSVVINRSAQSLASPDESPVWLEALLSGLPAASAAAVRALHDELRTRAAIEFDLRSRIEGALASRLTALPELPGQTPVNVVRELGAMLGGRP